MRLLALFLAGLLALASPGVAQQIDVRSGEHDGFSRLVFMFPPGTGWRTERVEGGYRLETETPRRFDLANVFRLIPKDRIRAVSADLDERSVFIETGPEVHLESFQLPIGAVVIDIADGADTTPIAAAGMQPGPVPPARSYRPEPNQGYLDLYWAGRPAAPQPGPPPGDAGEGITAEVAPKPAPPPEPSPEFTRLVAPDPRINAAELALIDQLGRAASQGLITMQMPADAPAHEATHDGPAPTAELAAEHAPDTSHAAATQGGDATGHPSAAPKEEGLALQSETVIDRDMAALFDASRLTELGHSCPSDRGYDLQSWLSEAPPAQQISEARRDLLEEFDKPRAESLEHLAQIYIALGFGAEAHALYPAFGLDTPPRIAALADLVEGNRPPPRPEFGAQISCNGKAALWALLALPEPPAKAMVNFGAVVRAYAALPGDIRNLIGPQLSARLIEVGAPDVAATVRSMLARAPVNTATALDVIDAQIDLSAGKVATATERLDRVAKSGNETAAEALALSIETKLSEGVAIAQADVENASALALQLRGSPLGAQLTRAAILGEGSTGQFDAAFHALELWDTPEEDAVRERTRNDLVAMQAKLPDDKRFIETFFRHRNAWSPEQIAPEVQVALADRLARIGFWISARTVIAPETRGTPGGRLALARAALAGHDAAAAYSHLIGLDGENAAQLRGEALSLLGRHDSAEQAFAEAGDTTSQTEAAWRAGDWRHVADAGSETQKRFLALFEDGAAPAASDATGAQPPGPIAAANDLLARSEAERAAFAKLMEDLRDK
ncbi:hypothetical protein [Rhodobacter maris]|uniref:Uncharacterized protein n=1 Tax=Rhodobacter maris TaxID=446682 RepID=A0A285SLG8_9RHOB|nr:hypothetical protein [Rhodobacter maris]SOC06838.1 hypothetical protein SAMN05877831_105156 [Rhodobacter maris]